MQANPLNFPVTALLFFVFDYIAKIMELISSPHIENWSGYSLDDRLIISRGEAISRILSYFQNININSRVIRVVH